MSRDIKERDASLLRSSKDIDYRRESKCVERTIVDNRRRANATASLARFANHSRIRGITLPAAMQRRRRKSPAREEVRRASKVTDSWRRKCCPSGRSGLGGGEAPRQIELMLRRNKFKRVSPVRHYGRWFRLEKTKSQRGRPPPFVPRRRIAMAAQAGGPVPAGYDRAYDNACNRYIGSGTSGPCISVSRPMLQPNCAIRPHCHGIR